MDRSVSKRKRCERSSTPEKPNTRKKIAFEIKNPQRQKITRYNSVFKAFCENFETSEPVINSKKTPELNSKETIENTEPEVQLNPQRHKILTPERDAEEETSYKADTEQLKVSLPRNLFDNNQRQSKEPRINATKNNNCKQKKNEDNEITKQDSKNQNNTTENHNYNCQCIFCEFKRKEEEDEIVYVNTVQSSNSQQFTKSQEYTRIITESVLKINDQMCLLLPRDEFEEQILKLKNDFAEYMNSLERIITTVDTTLHTLENKVTNIDTRLTEINQNHDKNWESVSETLAIVAKHIIDQSNIGSKGNDNHERARNLESPTTTSCEADILQKAEQFSEQNKAKLAKEKAENERNGRARTIGSQTLAPNQPFEKTAPAVMPHQQQIIQQTQDQLAKQQFAQHETQMAWQLDQQPSKESIELKEQQVRQKIVNFYQQQQNARLELQKNSQLEQMAAQREERTARQQEYEQAQASQNIAEQLDQIILNNEQIAQQQQLLGQHEQLMARHNERLALHQAQLAQQQFAKQQEIQLANEPTLSRDGMVQDSANTTPANELTQQRVLRPRPTPQVVLQYPFVQPKQKAPRKLTAKQIRERRASIQCEPAPTPSPTHYSHLPSMRLPAPVAQEAHPVQRNMRLAEENFQQQVPLPHAYTALQNQEIQQQQAAKLRARRASCQPSLSYLDQGLCHEMLRRRLTNAQGPSNQDQSSFYPQQQLRYFSNTPQPGNTNENYSQYTQNIAPEMATPANCLNLSVNNVEKTSQNLSQDPVAWLRGQSTSITRIPKTNR